MKKNLILLFVFIFLLGGAWVIFPGSVDHNSNFSPGYVRTFNRNAVTDSTDAAVYNPAGVTKLDDGLYVSVNNQFIFKNYSHKTTSDTYAAKNPTPLLPSVFTVFSKNRWGAFAAFTVPAGGGSLKYKDGIVDTAVLEALGHGPDVYGFSAYYAGSLGGAYAFNDMISVSLGGRFMYAKNTNKITLNKTIQAINPLGPSTDTLMEFEESASGFGGIIGINISPIKDLNIGVRYETITKLEFEVDKSTDNGSFLGLPPLTEAKGTTRDRDLPPLFGLGVSYLIIPELKVEASFNYYFTKQADWDGDEDDHKNGYELGAATEYSILSNLKASVGFLYTNQGADKESYEYLHPALDAISVCGGALYEVMPDLNLELGISGSFYLEDDGISEFAQPVTLNKKVLNIALGASYKIF